MSTGKSIFMRALGKTKTTERIPVAVLDGYTWMLHRAGMSYRDLMDMDAQEAAEFIYGNYTELQSDMVQTNAHLIYLLFEALGGKVEYEKKGAAVEVTIRPLKCPDDIRGFEADAVWSYIVQRPEWQNAMTTTKSLRQIARDHRALVAVSYAPFSIAAMLIGVQEFMEALFDDADSMESLFRFTLEIVTRFCMAQVEQGAEVIFLADPVASGDLISPATYDQYALPLLMKIVNIFRSRGIPVMCHICGNTESRLQPLCNSGIAAFSLDSVDLRTALDTAKGYYAIMGNMSPSSVLLQMSPEQVESHCRQLIEYAGPDANFILMPGCDLPPQTPLENIRAMVRASHDCTGP